MVRRALVIKDLNYITIIIDGQAPAPRGSIYLPAELVEVGLVVWLFLLSLLYPSYKGNRVVVGVVVVKIETFLL